MKQSLPQCLVHGEYSTKEKRDNATTFIKCFFIAFFKTSRIITLDFYVLKSIQIKLHLFAFPRP